MTPTEFCYWLQGFFELQKVAETSPQYNNTKINNQQAVLIEKHLNLVFAHSIDPKAGPPEHQQLLNSIHNSDNGPRPRC